MGALTRAAPWAAALALLAACKPDFDERSSAVTRARVLAVRATPPEVKPGAMVEFDLLVAGPDGTVEDASADWAFCATPRAPGDPDVVSPACLGDGVRPIDGSGPRATAAIPDDACTLFGPEPPPGGFRPRDPDDTGGYYQPVRARVAGADVAFGMARVVCNLADAPLDAASDYAKRYVPNHDPVISAVTATIDGAPVSVDAIPAGARVDWTVSWTDADAEAYVSFDRPSQTVVDRREAMRVSWFASAGAFDVDRTGRDEHDVATSTDDHWTAPSAGGAVHLWFVLRDSRGGVDFRSLDARVR